MLDLLDDGTDFGSYNVKSYTYSYSFDQISPEISIAITYNPPGGNVGGAPGTFFSPVLGNVSFDSYLLTKTFDVNGPSGTWGANLNYTGVASYYRNRAPRKPLHFMTMDFREYRVFLDTTGSAGLAGTAQNYLDFIPLVKIGDTFGRGGWTSYEIIEFLATKFGYQVITNIPNFFVKELRVTSSYFDAIMELADPYDVRYFMIEDTLYVLNYGQTLPQYFTGYANIIDGNVMTVSEAFVQRPSVVRVTGGDTYFHPALYTGRQVSGPLTLYTAPFYFGESVFNQATEFTPDPPESDPEAEMPTYQPNLIPVTYWSYPDPIISNEQNLSVESVDVDNFPALEGLIQGLENSLSFDGEALNLSTGRFLQTVQEIRFRTFFDEPGETVFRATRKQLIGFDGVGLLFDSSEEQYVISETYEWLEYGTTMHYSYEKPRCASVLLPGNSAEAISLLGKITLSSGESASTLVVPPRYSVCERKLKVGLLPNLSSNDVGSSLRNVLMPQELTLTTRIYAEETGPYYLRGDLIMEVEKTYAPVICAPDGLRRPLLERDMAIDLKNGNYILPELWDYFDPRTCRITDLMVSECVISETVRHYSRADRDSHYLRVETTALSEGTGKYMTTSSSSRVGSPIPSDPIAPRKAPMMLSLHLESPEGDGLTYTAPPMSMSFPLLVDWVDLQRAASVAISALLRPKAEITYTANYPFFVDLGWKFQYLNNQVTGPGGVLYQLPAHDIAVISKVTVTKDGASGQGSCNLTVDLY